MNPQLISWRQSLAVWVALMLLLVLSVALSQARPGGWSLFANIAIAALQVGLIGMFFMKLRRSGALILLTCAAALLFLAVMFSLTFNDLYSRV